MVRLVVLGNCQAQLLEAMFSIAAPEVTVTRFPPVFEMEEMDRQRVQSSLADADIVFSQRTADSFHLNWLTPGALRKEWGGKILIWPNIYFDGYFPRTQYIYCSDGRKLLSPLEDYHLAPLLEAFRNGASEREASEALYFECGLDQDSFEASFQQLEHREQSADVKISDFLREEANTRRCFYTPNHPFNHLLAEVGARLACHAGVAFDATAAAAQKYRLDRIYIPCFPAIQRRRSLPFDRVTVFRGLEVLDVEPTGIRLGRPRSYLIEELVHAYWRIYQIFEK